MLAAHTRKHLERARGAAYRADRRGGGLLLLLRGFPAAVALIASWGHWADPVVIETQLEMLEEFVQSPDSRRGRDIIKNAAAHFAREAI